ncbi:MAG: hypothetical protein COB54_06375 [Alphaproteobacteria bacterium]|nr:MAG: hypothetical protein COB54_06375 [Alphaproteobacteria bacterium]
MLYRITYSLRNVFRLLARQQKGAAAVEYALVLPVFLTMTMGGFELGRIYMVNASLEGAVSEATRTAMTGNLPEAYNTRSDYIEHIVLSNLKDVNITSGITVSMKVYESFSDIGDPEPYVDQNGNGNYDVGECYSDINANTSWDSDMGSSGAGGEENIMVMTVDVNLPYMTSYMISMMGGKETINLSASTVVRNEPFGGASWEPSTSVICS